MSKKLENIDIEVNELKGKNLPTWEVVIPNRKSIGLIEKVEAVSYTHLTLPTKA